MSLEQAIEVVVFRAPTTPSLSGGSAFQSIEAASLACDPFHVGLWAACNNRAAFRRLAADPPPQGCWTVTREEIDHEAELLEAETGFKRPRCWGGACKPRLVGATS